MRCTCKAWRDAVLEARPALLVCSSDHEQHLLTALTVNPVSDKVTEVNVQLHGSQQVPLTIASAIAVRFPNLRHLEVWTDFGAQQFDFLKYLPTALLSLHMDCTCTGHNRCTRFNFDLLDRFVRLESFTMFCSVTEAPVKQMILYGDLSLPLREFSIYTDDGPSSGSFPLPPPIILPDMTFSSMDRECYMEIEECLVRDSVRHPHSRRGSGRFSLALIPGVAFMQLLTKQDPHDIPGYPRLAKALVPS